MYAMAHEFENLRTEIAHSYTPASLRAPSRRRRSPPEPAIRGVDAGTSTKDE